MFKEIRSREEIIEEHEEQELKEEGYKEIKQLTDITENEARDFWKSEIFGF